MITAPLELAPPPDGLIQALSWDLSPRRPWEDALAEADVWTEAVELKNAYHQGLAEAQDEAAGFTSNEVGQVG